MDMVKVYFFDKALKYQGMTKKEFAKNAQIAYDTVVGWKRSGSVPNYAFVLLKKIAFTKNPRRHQLKLRAKNTIEITKKLEKEIEIAFWGKSYELNYILKEVKGGNPIFVKPFFENIFHADILKILSIKAIEKILPVIEQIFQEQTALFWRNVVDMYKSEGVRIA